MKRIAFALLAVSMSILPALAAPPDIAGTYVVTGTNPGGDSYKGKAVIAKTGDAYQISWVIGTSETYVGVGILDGDILSVSYASGNMMGVVSYRRAGDNFNGRWAILGGDGKVQTETLTRMAQ